MIPDIAKRGTSFVGASKYYLHDKRQEGEASRTTQERVDWTHTRGMMTDDPKAGINIMRATAEAQDDLKRGAGVKLTGNKSKGAVLAYSLSWSPEEKGQIDKTEMLKAVDTSLKALGAHDHQAVIVAHNDEPHPHCHVILNLVNQHNGKNLNLSHTKKKLDKWAYEYRKERGEEQKYCPDRTKKHEAIEARKRGQNPDFVKPTKKNFHRSQTAQAFDKATTHANSNETNNIKKDQKAKDADLFSYGRKQAEIHKSEWAVLSSEYQTQKADINRRAKDDIQRVKDEIFQQGKPYYVEMLRSQRAELSAFNQRESRVLGKINNMVAAVTHSARLGRPENKNVVSQLFKTISNKDQRQAWIKAKHDKQIREFKRDQNAQVKTATKNINQTKKERTGAALDLFQFNRQGLIRKQDTRNQDLKDRWKTRNMERKQAFRQLAKTTQKRQETKKHIIDGVEVREVNKDFEAKTRPKRTRKPRARTRKRTRSDD